jgi:hypothetical protein
VRLRARRGGQDRAGGPTGESEPGAEHQPKHGAGSGRWRVADDADDADEADDADDPDEPDEADEPDEHRARAGDGAGGSRPS